MDRLAGGGDGEAAVRRFLVRCPDATLFFSWEWLTCAERFIPAGRHLQVLAVARDGELIGLLPVTRGRERLHGVTVTTLRFLGAPLADRMPLPIFPRDERTVAEVLDGLYTAADPWDVALLGELAIADEHRRWIDGWGRRAGRAIHWRWCARTPVLDLTAFADAEALRASYSKTLRTRLRRGRKKLHAAGEVVFRRSTPTPEEADALLPQLKAIEDASWKGEQGVGIFSSAESFSFFQELSASLAARGVLDIGELWLDGRLITYRYGFRHHDAFLDYNLAYHPSVAPLSPGRILLDEMVLSSLTDGLTMVDASRGSLHEQHLLADWTNRHIDHHELWLFSGSARSRALSFARRRLRSAWRRLRGMTSANEGSHGV